MIKNSNFWLIIILLYSLIIRIFHLSDIPPILEPSFLHYRLLSACFFISSLIFIYRILLIVTGQKKALVLLTIFFMTNAIWAIIESRIYSPVIYFSFFCSILLFLHLKSKKIFILLSLPTIFLMLISAKDFLWLFTSAKLINAGQFITNLFHLISFDYLFFQNDSFWWGGIRQLGIFDFSLIPFFIIGFFIFFYNFSRYLFVIFLSIWFFTAASPLMPESREFYLNLPFLSYIIALGFYYFYKLTYMSDIKYLKLLFIVIFLILVYSHINILHYYFVHYPIHINNEYQNINQPF